MTDGLKNGMKNKENKSTISIIIKINSKCIE